MSNENGKTAKTSEPDFTLHIDGKAYPVMVDDLELWEIEFIEDLCNAPLAEIDFGRIKPIKALTWLVLRRSDPNITLEDVGRIKLGALNEPEGEPDPTPPPTPSPAKRSAAPK